MSDCPSTAYLYAQGVVVGVLRCDLVAPHPELAHAARLTWEDPDPALEWPDAFDPEEGFDVEVDALPHDEVIDARIATRSIGDDLAIERSHEAVDVAERQRADLVDLQRRYGAGPTGAGPAPLGQ